MKKLFAMILVLVMLLTLVACGGKEESKKGEEKNDEKKENGVITIGDYTATFLGAELMKDSYGADVLAVHLNYANNSKEATKFDWAFYYNAKQGDEELQYAVVWVSEDSYDTLADGLQEDVAPGENKDVTMTYELKDLTTPVTIKLFDLEGRSGTYEIDLTKLSPATEAADPVETEPAETDEPTEETEPAVGEISADWWLGDWYGTWTVVNGTGDYEQYAGESWDCCGYINSNGENDFFLSIWDEDYNDYNNDCLAETQLVLRTEYAYGEHGAMQTTDDENNYFWTSTLNSNSWYIDPGLLDYNHTFTIYSEITDENGTCEYMITLCKWGTEWDENAGAYPEYYDTYFLPLMKEAVELPPVFEPNN